MHKTDFFRAVNLALTQDRPRFIGRWQRLRNLPDDKRQQAEQQLQHSLQQSQQQAQQRLQAVPPLKLNEDLPVSQRANEIIEAIKNHQVVVLAGETGSGKTTQLPQYLHEIGYSKIGKIGFSEWSQSTLRTIKLQTNCFSVFVIWLFQTIAYLFCVFEYQLAPQYVRLLSCLSAYLVLVQNTQGKR